MPGGGQQGARRAEEGLGDAPDGRPGRVRPAPSLVVLGLDPGSRHTGFGLIEKQGDRLRPLAHGRLSCAAEVSVGERMLRLSDGLDELLTRWRPQTAVLESLFHGANSRSLIVLAQARGVLLAALARAGIVVHEYTPAQVKMAVTGNGRADKEQVARMVRILLALGREPISADATDALAVAICGANRERLDALSRGVSRGAQSPGSRAPELP